MSKHTPTRIRHIPGYRSSPRTLSQAQRRAEADSLIDAVRRAKAPALGARSLEGPRKVNLWAIAALLVIVGLFTFFAAYTNPVAALAATAICSGVIGMCVVAMAVRRAEEGEE